MQHYDIHWLIEKFDNGDPLKFVHFWGHTNAYNEEVGKFCFSQWFESPFTVDAIAYKTSEHWMMAQKAVLFHDRRSFERIINCNKPGEAKKLGREVSGYDDQIWDTYKFDIVKIGNIHKFNQNPLLAEYLLKTDHSVLVEASPVDTIWGIGLSHDNREINNIYAWRGQNLLGFVLMEVRDFLKEFGSFQPLDNALPAPWATYPEVDYRDMFWRMGQGEEYLINFLAYYTTLNAREKIIYKLTHPQPHDWASFYDELV